MTIITGNVLTEKGKKLLNEDIGRNSLMAIYDNRVESFKSLLLIDDILGGIEQSVNELQDGNSQYSCTPEMKKI